MASAPDFSGETSAVFAINGQGPALKTRTEDAPQRPRTKSGRRTAPET